VAVDQILRTNENDAPCARRLDYELVTGLEPSLAQRVNWQRRLILAADAGMTTPPLLYLRHEE
jgi:hypothetical protein